MLKVHQELKDRELFGEKKDPDLCPQNWDAKLRAQAMKREKLLQGINHNSDGTSWGQHPHKGHIPSVCLPVSVWKLHIRSWLILSVRDTTQLKPLQSHL